MTRRRAIELVLGGALLSLALWLVIEVRWVSEEVDDGFGADARANPYLAAEQFLERLGIATEYRIQRGIDLTLPPPDHALLLIDSELGLTDGVADRLAAWVGEGGHLLVDSEHVASRRPWDFWLRRLGFERYDPFEEPGAEEDADMPAEAPSPDGVSEPDGANAPPPPFGVRIEKRQDGEQQPQCATETVGVWWAPSGGAGATDIARVALDDGVRFVDWPPGEVAAAGDETGMWLVRVPSGAGVITALGSTHPFRNADIECHDHAYLLERLIADRQGVWIVRHIAIPHWLELLWDHGWPLVKSLAIAVLLAIWLGARAFGPRAEPPASGRRGLADHLRAAGELLWRRRAVVALLADAREAIAQRARRRFFRSDWRAELVQHAGVPIARVAAALESQPRTESELVDVVRTLRELEQRL